MATVAAPFRLSSLRARLSTRRGARAGVAAYLLALVGGSFLLRTTALDAGFWIDEGLSVGIASYPLTEIPTVLLQDGSPPLYYMLLHVWMELFGREEVAVHVLSLIFGLLAIPAALWAGWSLFGPRVGLVTAALAALNPFLTLYAQETRMYALMVLLSLLATACFLHAFLRERRGYLVPFAALLATMLYTHNWAVFFVPACLGALGFVLLRRPDARRRLLRDGLLAFGAAGVAFLPWLPSLVFQATHTGAPWGEPPAIAQLTGGLGGLLGREGPAIAILLAGGAGLAAIVRRGARRETMLMLALVTITFGTLLIAFLFSQVSPAWAYRYLAVVLGPLLLLCGVGLARAGRLGLVVLALVVVFWSFDLAPPVKSNARSVMTQLAPQLRAGDLVISTHPEQVPVLSYYAQPGLRFATPLGGVRELGVMDWRDAMPRLRRTRVASHLEPLMDSLPPGARLVLVRPIIGNGDGWNAPWTYLVRRRSSQWARTLAADPRFLEVDKVPKSFGLQRPRGVRATVYAKRFTE